MRKRPGNPYSVLYWMGGALLLLIVAVVLLIMLMPKQAATPADPERTVLYIYDPAEPTGPAAVTIIEESRSRGTLVAVPFPASSDVRQAYGKSARAAQEALQSALGRRLHNRVFLPDQVVARLIDAAGGITVEGQALDGQAALAYIAAGADQSASRAGQVMLALAEAAASRGINMSLKEGLSLAGNVETDLDLMALPEVLSRWNSYGSLRVETVSGDPASVSEVLLPDPPAEQTSF